MVECSLTARDLSRILAFGQAIATKPTTDRECFTLTVRYTFPRDQPAHPHATTYHVVLEYTWPPDMEQWICFLVRVYEPTVWFDDAGYQRCWCSHYEEDDDV